MRGLYILVVVCLFVSSLGLVSGEARKLSLVVTGGSRGQVVQSDKWGNDCDAEDIAAGECFGGYERKATFIDNMKSSNAATFVLDLGEIVGFKGFWRLFKGKAHQALYNALGYDAIAIAKSDLFQGPYTYKNIVDGAEFAVVNVNMDWSNSILADTKLARFVLLQRGGVTIAVTSIFDEVRMWQTNMGGAVAKNLYASLSDTIGELRGRGGVDLVVVMAALMTESNIRELVHLVQGIDLVIGNFEGADFVHDKTFVRTCEDCQDGGAHIQHLDITFETTTSDINTAINTVTKLDSSIASKPSVEALVKGFHDTVIQDENSNILGTCAEKMIGERSVCRFRSCNLGNFLADVLKGATTQNTQVAFVNSGSIRANIEVGQVTLGNVLTALPFGDPVSTFELYGGDLVKALEWSVGGIAAGKTTGRFLQISGVQFDWNTNTSTVAAVRVLNENGTYVDIDMQTKYRCATTSFIRQGGDGFDVLSGKALNVNDNGPSLKEKVGDYFLANSPVTAPTEDRHHHTTELSSLLSRCRPGHGLQGDLGCGPCPPGKFRSADMEEQTCFDCLDGYYAPFEGTQVCTACGPNMRTYLPGAINVTSCECEKGFFGDFNGCTACPLGGACPGSTSFVNVAAGYVRSPIDPVKFRACIPPDACLGGSNTTCAEGYTGENCGKCVNEPNNRYFRRSGKCVACRNPDTTLLITSFFLLLIVAAGLLVLSLMFTTDTSRRRRGLVGILALVMQTFALFPFFYPETWPNALDVLYNFISLFNLNIDLFAFECSFALSSVDKWLFALFIPALFAVNLVSAYGFYLLYVGYLRGKGSISDAEVAKKKQQFRDSCVGSMFVFLVFGYTFFSTIAMSVFDCTSEEDGTSFLASAPAVPCYDKSWVGIAAAGTFFTLLYPVGIPLSLYLLLRRNKGNFDDPRFKARFGIFVDEYHSHRWYWLIVLLGWRLVLITAKTFVPISWSLRGVLGVMIVFALLFLKVYGRARVDPLVAIVDMYCSLGLLIVFYFGFVLHTSDLNSFEDGAITGLFYAVVIVVSVTAVSLAVWALFGYKIWRKIRGTSDSAAPLGEAEIALEHSKASRKNSNAVFQRRESVAMRSKSAEVLPYFDGPATEDDTTAKANVMAERFKQEENVRQRMNMAMSIQSLDASHDGVGNHTLPAPGTETASSATVSSARSHSGEERTDEPSLPGSPMPPQLHKRDGKDIEMSEM